MTYDTCNNCGQRIALKANTRWTARGIDGPTCPARPEHVGHIPQSAYQIIGMKSARKMGGAA